MFCDCKNLHVLWLQKLAKTCKLLPILGYDHHRRTRRGVGGGPSHRAWKISGHTLCFRASVNCSKILNVKSIFNTVKNFRANSVFRTSTSGSKILNVKNIFHAVNSRQLYFSGQAQSCSKILNVKSIFNTVKIFRENCLHGKRKLLKNPEYKNYIQYSEKFQGTRCVSGQA